MSNSIEEQAESRFRGSGHSELRQIRCTIHHGILTLSGSVSSYEVRQVAQEMIKELKGIDIIDNQIVIDDQ
jgi:osmotically-inducible protein OsmY